MVRGRFSASFAQSTSPVAKVGLTILLLLAPLAAAAAEDQPFLLFSQTGGLTAHRKINLQVNWSGNVKVDFEPNARQLLHHSYSVGPEHLVVLSNVLESVRFFDIGESNSYRNVDIPDHVLTATTLGGRTRTLHFQRITSFGPLHKELQRFIEQSVVSRDLETFTYAPDALRQLAYGQPEVVRPDLLSPLVEKWTDYYRDRSELEHTLAALSHLMTLERWMDYVTNGVRTASEGRRAMLLSIFASHQFHYALPTNNITALLPYITAVVDAYGDPSIALNDSTESLVCEMIFFLSRKNYQEAIPVLWKYAEAHPDVNSRSGSSAGRTAKRLRELEAQR